MTLNDVLLVLVWLFPLGLGLVQAVQPERTLRLAPFAALPALIASLIVPIGETANNAVLLLGVQFQLDAIAQTFLFFTAALWLASSLFAYAYIKDKQPQFFAFFLLAMAGNLGLIVAGDMLWYYFTFALMSFASYGLVLHTGDMLARRAGTVYIALVVIGEVMLFAAIVMIANATGTTRFAELAGQIIPDIPAALILMSFGIKAGVVLLHVWLPLAHPAAPVPASAVLSGAMIKAGLLGWLRFLPPETITPDWGLVLVVVGVIGAFYGAIMGVPQHNPKTVLAYSSISQMGLITAGAGVWLWSGAAGALLAVLLYALHHALAKGALFLGVSFAGKSRYVPFILLIPALALAGLPVTSGAVAKAALKEYLSGLPADWYGTVETLLTLGAIGTTLLMIRFLWIIWQTPTSDKPLPRLMWGAWLGVIVAVAGVMFLWPDAAESLTKSFETEKLWTGVWPIGVGIGVGGIGLLLLGRIKADKPLLPAGDVLLIFEPILKGALVVIAGIYSAYQVIEKRLWDATGDAANILMGRSKTLGRWEVYMREWAFAGGVLAVLTLAILLIASGTL